MSQEPREQPYLSPSRKWGTLSGYIAAIEKRVFLLTMAMNVAVDENFLALFLRDLAHKSLGVVHFWMQLLIWQDPLAVEV